MLSVRRLKSNILPVQKRFMSFEIVVCATATVVVSTIASAFHVVKPNRKGLVEVFGKYTKTVDPGLRIIWPLGIGTMTLMPTDMQRVEIPGQSIITKEQLNAVVHAVVYYQVIDPVKAKYNVDDFQTTVPSLAQTTLRNVLGTFTLAEANSCRKKINNSLRVELESQIKDWGMRVVSVELQQIEPTKRVQDSMNNIVVAEQEMIAATNIANAEEIKADGIKRAAVKEAEGKATALELDAKAKAIAVEMAAIAEARAIAVKYKAVKENFTGNVIEYQKLITTEESLRNNSTILLPQNGRNVTLFDVSNLK